MRSMVLLSLKDAKAMKGAIETQSRAAAATQAAKEAAQQAAAAAAKDDKENAVMQMLLQGMPGVVDKIKKLDK